MIQGRFTRDYFYRSYDGEVNNEIVGSNPIAAAIIVYIFQSHDIISLSSGSLFATFLHFFVNEEG